MVQCVCKNELKTSYNVFYFEAACKCGNNLRLNPDDNMDSVVERKMGEKPICPNAWEAQTVRKQLSLFRDKVSTTGLYRHWLEGDRFLPGIRFEVSLGSLLRNPVGNSNDTIVAKNLVLAHCPLCGRRIKNLYRLDGEQLARVACDCGWVRKFEAGFFKITDNPYIRFRQTMDFSGLNGETEIWSFDADLPGMCSTCHTNLANRQELLDEINKEFSQFVDVIDPFHGLYSLKIEPQAGSKDEDFHSTVYSRDADEVRTKMRTVFTSVLEKLDSSKFLNGVVVNS